MPPARTQTSCGKCVVSTRKGESVRTNQTLPEGGACGYARRHQFAFEKLCVVEGGLHEEYVDGKKRYTRMEQRLQLLL